MFASGSSCSSSITPFVLRTSSSKKHPAIAWRLPSLCDSQSFSKVSSLAPDSLNSFARKLCIFSERWLYPVQRLASKFASSSIGLGTSTLLMSGGARRSRDSSVGGARAEAAVASDSGRLPSAGARCSAFLSPPLPIELSANRDSGAEPGPGAALLGAAASLSESSSGAGFATFGRWPFLSKLTSVWKCLSPSLHPLLMRSASAGHRSVKVVIKSGISGTT
mmetsp:Transcript_61031/g.106307  ORF Transcript_61031/g.106307 Transcript_61031/m.106307 type:complete len:221 (-) Transcript_61031:709-1371(-)